MGRVRTGRDGGDTALALVVDLHRADRGDPPEPHRGVEVGAADAQPAGGLVRAERDVPVEEGAGKRVDLVRVDVGEGDFADEVDEEPGRTR
ncbi:hypothetical protein [Streptomyces sp. DSM 40907]|uniref:hypothetical protein n=1 Tax=Streptomyces kutzneri TaxID=3051179 RepID=UPI0028D45184|nr:hypothetical protein [Streptomyces sp. DSM 40907]